MNPMVKSMIGFGMGNGNAVESNVLIPNAMGSNPVWYHLSHAIKCEKVIRSNEFSSQFNAHQTNQTQKPTLKK